MGYHRVYTGYALRLEVRCVYSHLTVLLFRMLGPIFLSASCKLKHVRSTVRQVGYHVYLLGEEACRSSLHVFKKF